jgi:hypothetical protein
MRGTHPNSQKNLKKFKEGESGNPSGRGKSFTKMKDALKELADEEVETNQIGWDLICNAPRKELVHRAIWDKAQDGDKWAIALLERLGCLD